jgi:DNA-binding MarR family transcriptional regulator
MWPESGQRPCRHGQRCVKSLTVCASPSTGTCSAASGSPWPRTWCSARSPWRQARACGWVDIAGLLTIAKSAVTKTVDRLEDRGLITREKDPADRRTIHATLTAEGERLFALAQPEFVTAVQRHFAGHISQAEIRCLAGLPRRLPQPALSLPALTVKEPR